MPARGRDFDALIDTGFTGFAQMPQASAVDIGLTPTGTMDLTFSDGSTEANASRMGEYSFGGFPSKEGTWSCLSRGDPSFLPRVAWPDQPMAIIRFDMSASEIIFIVDESPEGGFEARALSQSIYTQ